MPLCVRKVVVRKREYGAANQAWPVSASGVSAKQKRINSAEDKCKYHDQVMCLNYTEKSQKNDAKETVERVESVAKERHTERIMKVRCVPW